MQELPRPDPRRRGRIGAGGAQAQLGLRRLGAARRPRPPSSRPGCGWSGDGRRAPRRTGPRVHDRRPRRRRGLVPGAAAGRAARPHLQGVRAPQDAGGAPEPGVHPRAAAAGGLGLRLLRGLAHRRRAHPAPARQARPRARGADRDGAGRGLQARPAGRPQAGRATRTDQRPLRRRRWWSAPARARRPPTARAKPCDAYSRTARSLARSTQSITSRQPTSRRWASPARSSTAPSRPPCASGWTARL